MQNFVDSLVAIYFGDFDDGDVALVHQKGTAAEIVPVKVKWQTGRTTGTLTLGEDGEKKKCDGNFLWMETQRLD